MNADVVAATLTILFEGLVAVIGPDSGGDKSKTHVAIVNDRQHSATITLQEPGDTPKSIDLKEGDRITFSIGSALASGTAMTEPSFDDRVPTMSDYILVGDLDKRVKGKKPLQDAQGEVVLAYLELPNGNLSAEGSLKHVAQITKKNGKKDIRCPAKIVRFTMIPDPTEPVRVTIQGNPPKRPLMRTLDLSQPVLIENTTYHPGSHYNIFKRLLEFGGKMGLAGEISTQDCDKDGRIMSVEETRLRRRETSKRFSPNGDCGATDFP